MDSYDGSRDPCNHIASFKTLMHFQGIPDEIICIAFLAMLNGSIRVWFSKLTSNTLSSFQELSKSFINNFIGEKVHKQIKFVEK